MAEWESGRNAIRADWGKFAWWYLSKRQKQSLKEQRAKGRFGGTPGKPTYWYLHEAGKKEVGINATHFMRKAQPRIRELVRQAVERATKRAT